MCVYIYTHTRTHSTANIILNGKKLEAFPVRSGIGKDAPSTINIVMQVLANAVRQGKETKGILTEKEEIKLSLFIEGSWQFLTKLNILLLNILTYNLLITLFNIYPNELKLMCTQKFAHGYL